MNFRNETEAIDLLREHDVLVSSEYDIMYPRQKEFVDEIHDAIDYLIDEHGYGIRYV
jgi:hypothetical protein